MKMKRIYIFFLVVSVFLASCGEGSAKKYRLHLKGGDEITVSCKYIQGISHEAWLEFRCGGQSYDIVYYEKLGDE